MERERERESLVRHPWKQRSPLLMSPRFHVRRLLLFTCFTFDIVQTCLRFINRGTPVEKEGVQSVSLTVELRFNFSDRKFRLIVVIVVATRKTKSSVLFAIVRVLVRYTARFDSARNLTRYNRRQNEYFLPRSASYSFDCIVRRLVYRVDKFGFLACDR